MTSSVLRSGPTSQRRASSPCVRRLRDAALSCQGDTGISRFPDEVRPRVHGVFDRAGSAPDSRWRQRRCGLPHIFTASAPWTLVDFAAQYPAHVSPCQRFTAALADVGA
jgi:hypothetical protein